MYLYSMIVLWHRFEVLVLLYIFLFLFHTFVTSLLALTSVCYRDVGPEGPEGPEELLSHIQPVSLSPVCQTRTSSVWMETLLSRRRTKTMEEEEQRWRPLGLSLRLQTRKLS